MIRREFVRAAGVLSAVAAVGPTQVGAQSPPSATLRFIGTANEDLLPFWYAQSNGAFVKAGLNVTLTAGSTGTVATEAIVAGAADIGRSSPQSIISAHVHGIPLVIVWPSGVHHQNVLGNAAIAVAPSAPFKSVLDLQGKVIACTAIGDVGYLGLRSLLDQSGGDSTTLKWIEMPIPTVAAALGQGRIDAGLTNEPTMTRDLLAGKIRIFVDMLDGYKGTVAQNVYFTTKNYAQANAGTINSFIGVLRQATQYVTAHESETLGLLVKNTGIDPEVAAKMHHMSLATAWDPSLVQPLIDVAAKYKQIPQRFDARELYWATS